MEPNHISSSKGLVLMTESLGFRVLKYNICPIYSWSHILWWSVKSDCGHRKRKGDPSYRRILGYLSLWFPTFREQLFLVQVKFFFVLLSKGEIILLQSKINFFIMLINIIVQTTWIFSPFDQVIV